LQENGEHTHKSRLHWNSVITVLYSDNKSKSQNSMQEDH